MITRRTHIQAALEMRSVRGTVSVYNDEQGALCVDFERLAAFSDLPFGKFRALSLLKKLSRRIAQPIRLTVGGRRWLTIRNGRLSVHNLLTTIRSLFE